MSNTLAEELLARLQGEPMQQISQQVGADPQQTTGAIGAALPLLLAALGRNAAQPGGADALFGALQRDHGGTDAEGALSAALAGNRSDGGNILGHVFGDNLTRAEAGLGQVTGLGSGSAGTLLRLLAPAVLAFLARRVSQNGLNSGDLGQTLGHEREEAARHHGGLLGAVLDRDGDGQVDLGDLLKAGKDFLGGRG
ncbi:MAG: DUF937 domain-containing protein [Gammaproteobacteria bacterium]